MSVKSPEMSVKSPDQKFANHMMGLLLGIHTAVQPYNSIHTKICELFDNRFTNSKLLRNPIPEDLSTVDDILKKYTNNGLKSNITDFFYGINRSTNCIILPGKFYCGESYCKSYVIEKYAVPYLQDGNIQFKGIEIKILYVCDCIDDCKCHIDNPIEYFDPLITFENICVGDTIKATYIMYSVFGYIEAVRYLLKIYPNTFSLERIAVLHKGRKQMYCYCINCFTVQHCPTHLCTLCHELDEGKKLYNSIMRSINDPYHAENVKKIYRNHLSGKIREVYYKKPRSTNMTISQRSSYRSTNLI